MRRLKPKGSGSIQLLGLVEFKVPEARTQSRRLYLFIIDEILYLVMTRLFLGAPDRIMLEVRSFVTCTFTKGKKTALAM